ncbi:hypothetical protein M0802_005299 [Mischocyttarus mexicanus]|nr:hypothetical protein M0802_005299 [Mischocyttarus mexicanus]
MKNKKKISIYFVSVDENATFKEETLSPPTRPPRKYKKNSKLDESQKIVNRESCNAKLIGDQLKKIPNESLKPTIPKIEVDLVSNDDESKLRPLYQETVRLFDNMNDNVEMSEIRESWNVTRKELKNKSETVYMNLPSNLGIYENNSLLTSTQINHINDSYNSKTLIVKLNEEKILTIKIKNDTNTSCNKNNENSSSLDLKTQVMEFLRNKARQDR